MQPEIVFAIIARLDDSRSEAEAGDWLDKDGEEREESEKQE